MKSDTLYLLSRTLSHALRHEPWLYELEIDDEGWVSVESVLLALRKEQPAWTSLKVDDLIHMIECSRTRRHEIRDGRIRALYGHSLVGRLRRSPAVPPEVLYHGTAPDTVSVIEVSGLLPMSRHYVHLSVDEGTAFEVGRRKSKCPTVLRVLAKKAYAKGIHFYEGNGKVWLAEALPPEFIV